MVEMEAEENIVRAAVIQAVGGEPLIEEFADPTGDDVAEVVAAPLNPVDLVIVAGQMPARPVSAPFIAGMEGIARLADGSFRYFAGPRLPFGSLAERVPLAGAETAAVPAGLDPMLAAALGMSGLAAWLSLSSTGHLARGESVLILGAEGQVGQIATQAARLLGASRVVGAVRTDESRQLVLDHGADAAVSTADLDTLTERLRAVVGDGVDLIIDLVWGPVIAHALDVARLRARAVQVGNSGAALATLSALGLRNKLVSILPHTNWAFSAAERAAAYEQLAAHAASGALRLQIERVPLDDAPSAWRRLKTGTAARKLVIIP
jgi:NADPH:quinone reductase-like Zn-dependent oxidoreductase